MNKPLTVLLCLVIAVVAFAKKGDYDYGIKCNPGLMGVYGDNADDTKTKFSSGIGFYYNYGVNNSFTIQPELLWTSRGFKMEIDGDDKYANFSYISIPVLTIAEMPLTHPVNPSDEVISAYFLAGPEISFRLSSTFDGTDVSENVKGTDFGLVFGAGIKMNNFLAGFRYNLGLVDLGKDEDSKTKNYSITLDANVSVKSWFTK